MPQVHSTASHSRRPSGKTTSPVWRFEGGSIPGLRSWWRPYKIVQTPSLIVELFEFVGGFRQIFLDGRKHPADPDPTWLGHSIGRWEGDTLVIDTIGVNDRSWLPAFLPHTEMLHMIERYRRPDLAHLNIDVAIEDPGTFTKPWQLHMVWTLAPREEIEEAVCENNKYIENTRPK